MPKVAKELSALDVRRLAHPGRGGHANFQVGGVSGLMLQVTEGGGKSWVLRTLVGGQRRHIGLGSFPEVSLATARDKAREAKEMVRQGIDPVVRKRAVRDALRASQEARLTFAKAMERYLFSTQLAEIARCGPRSDAQGKGLVDHVRAVSEGVLLVDCPNLIQLRSLVPFRRRWAPELVSYYRDNALDAAAFKPQRLAVIIELRVGAVRVRQ
jgi:Arm DNA-binding domain